MSDGWDFDHAMCTYLGGELDSSAIQIGMRDERLRDAFGDDISSIKAELDSVLKDAVEAFKAGDLPVEVLLAGKLPNASAVTRGKIAGHVIYWIEH